MWLSITSVIDIVYGWGFEQLGLVEGDAAQDGSNYMNFKVLPNPKNSVILSYETKSIKNNLWIQAEVQIMRFLLNSTGTISAIRLKDKSQLNHCQSFPSITTGLSIQELSY